MNPPIKNIGIKGIGHTSKEILKWPEIFNEHELRMNLFSLYIYIEVGGTGGGCFRYMYSRFLEEAARIREMKRCWFQQEIQVIGRTISAIGQMFTDAEESPDIKDKILLASSNFYKISKIESEAFSDLTSFLPGNNQLIIP